MKNSIQYYLTGHGPNRLLFLHGWLSDHRVFETILPLFNPAKYTIVCPDYRGYGRSKGLSGQYSIEEIAADVLNLTEQLDWEQFDAISHSMGAQVIQKIALKRPALLKSAIMITPVPASGFQLDDQSRAFFESSASNNDALEQIFNTLTGDRHADSFLQQMTRNARLACSKDAYLGYLKAWTETNFAAEVGAIDTPVLLIAGEHDGALGPQLMKDTCLKQLNNVSMKVLNGAGHYPMQETPIDLFDIIESSLNKSL